MKLSRPRKQGSFENRVSLSRQGIRAAAWIGFFLASVIGGPEAQELGVVTFVMEVDETGAEILSPLRMTPWIEPPDDQPDAGRFFGVRPGPSQIGLVFTDEDKNVVGLTTIPGQSVVYVDAMGGSGASDLPRGLRGPQPARRDIRRLSVRVPAGARHMTAIRRITKRPRHLRDERFHDVRFHVSEGDSVARGMRALATFGLPAPGRPAPTEPPGSLPVVSDFGAWNRMTRDDESGIAFQPVSLVEEGEAEEDDRLSDVSVETISPCNGDDPCYKMVVTGDGFTDADVYRDAAQTLIDGLMEIEPYKSLSDQIEVLSIVVESEDPGIDRCGGVIGPETFYEVIGSCSNLPPDVCPEASVPEPPESAFCSDPMIVYEAGEPIVPYDQVNMYLVLANCQSTLLGGLSHPKAYIGYVTWDGARVEESVLVASHELGHVIAGLGEEYGSCVEWHESTGDDGGDEDEETVESLEPNLFYMEPPPNDPHSDEGMNEIAERMEGVPWLDVFESEHPGEDFFERDGDSFVNLHACFNDDECDSHNDIEDTEFTSELGLYWGGQYINDDGDGDRYEECCKLDLVFDESLGTNIYRPTVMCKMRREAADYCIVCETRIRERILNPTEFIF